ncbi:hypothetical protein ACTFIY_010789 [Dictyostelium cf. discoideum]
MFLNLSLSLSEKLKCQTICHVLQLKFLKVGYNFFSLFDTFKFTSSETNSFISGMKRIVEAVEEESNSLEKVLIIKNISLSTISSSFNLLISSCNEAFKINKEFIESLVKAISLIQNEEHYINNQIFKIQSKITEIENLEDKKWIKSKSNQNYLGKLRNEEIEKKTFIENIEIIVANLEKIQKNNNSNIIFIESVKNIWSIIYQDFQNLSKNSLKQLILSETNTILLKIDILRQQLNSILVGNLIEIYTLLLSYPFYLLSSIEKTTKGVGFSNTIEIINEIKNEKGIIGFYKDCLILSPFKYNSFKIINDIIFRGNGIDLNIKSAIIILIKFLPGLPIFILRRILNLISGGKIKISLFSSYSFSNLFYSSISIIPILILKHLIITIGLNKINKKINKIINKSINNNQNNNNNNDNNNNNKLIFHFKNIYFNSITQGILITILTNPLEFICRESLNSQSQQQYSGTSDSGTSFNNILPIVIDPISMAIKILKEKGITHLLFSGFISFSIL